MNEQTVVEKKRNSPPRGAGGATKTRRYTPEEKLKAVRLYREEGFSMALISQELGVSKSSVEHWLKAYQLGGEAGLQSFLSV
jgi:transposase-like protein